MTEIPQPELIFPCDYPVTMIGKDENEFEAFAIELISRHVPGLSLQDFTTRPSHGGKYIAVSVRFTAESRAQVDALYLEIGQHKRILVAL